MTAGDLERIEKELNLSLPGSYRVFMQSGTFGAGDDGAQELNGLADEVIESNKEVRQRGFFGVEWPVNYFVVGDDGAGDYYFMDIQCNVNEVFFADHELTSNKRKLVISQKKKYRTLSEFWDFIVKTNERQEQWEKKRWWKFFTRPVKFK